jgi:predicted GNAT family acetyltransferase
LLGRVNSSDSRRIVVEDNGQIIAVALMSPDRPLLISHAPAQAIPAIVTHVLSWNLKSVNAPVAVAREFCQQWKKLTGQSFTLRWGLASHQLDRVISPPPVPGELQLATIEHRDLVIQWITDYSAEIDDPCSDPAQLCQTLLSAGQLFLWHNHHPVSMAGWAGPTPNGIRINSVYTPREFRGRGYASACVAALSQRLLDSGRKFCFLNTDLANPISNRIYERIGYCRVGEAENYSFSESH